MSWRHQKRVGWLAQLEPLLIVHVFSGFHRSSWGAAGLLPSVA